MSDKELLTNPTDEENILQNPLEHEAEPIKEDEKYKEPLQNINDISQNVSNEIKEAAKEEQKQREADQVPFEEFGSFEEQCEKPARKFPIKSVLLLAAIVGGSVLIHRMKKNREARPVAQPESAPLKESYLP